MSDSTVIKEFLVALGFKVEDKKLKEFTGGIDKATKFVGKLAGGLETMAVAATAAVTKVSQQFEDLYYASIRLSDSVENIRATTFEIGQIGGTAKGSLQALENLGEFFRSNPGGERFVEGLGVQTRKTNGELRGMTEIFKDLGPVLRSMPYYRAKVVANVLGIDPSTLQALLRDTGEASAKFHALAERMGVDQDAAAKASRDFMNDLRELLALITLTIDKIVLRIQPTAKKVVQWFEDMDEATKGWSTTLAILTAVLLPLLLILDPIVIAIAAIAILLTQVDWSQWSGPIGEVNGALRDFLSACMELWTAIKPFVLYLAQAFGPVLSDIVKAFFDVLTMNFRGLAGLIRVVADLLTGQWSKAWTDAGKAARDTMQGIINLAKDGLEILQAFWNLATGRHDKFAPERKYAAPPANDNKPEAAGASPRLSQGAQDVASTIHAFLKQKGFTQEQSRGITAGIHAESTLDPTAVNPTSGAYGIGQWLGPRKRELFRRYGNRPNLEQQLEFLVWELMGGDRGGAAVRGQSTSEGAMSAYVKKFMRPAPGKETSGDINRGLAYLSTPRPLVSAPPASTVTQPAGGAPSTTTINQTNTYHIDGSKDPQATKRLVSDAQAQTNDAMVRNLKVSAS